MAITDYTSYAEVRSACGLSIKELPDTVLALDMFDNALYLELQGVTLPDEAPGPGPLDTCFAAIDAMDEEDRTTSQKKLFALTRLFSTYVVAYRVMMSGMTRTPKTISDSKASLTRFSSEATIKDTKAEILLQIQTNRAAIEDINETTIEDPLNLLYVVEPDTDVVTDS